MAHLNAVPPVNLLISTLYFIEGVGCLWNPTFWFPVMFVNGEDIKFDDTHKMFCMWMAGCMFALSAAFCSLDGRIIQTRALVMGNMILLYLSLRVHQTIMPMKDVGLYVLAFYFVLLVMSYMSAEGAVGPKCLKAKKS